MSSPIEKKRYSLAEYFQLEAKSVDKHEFHDGLRLAMAGGKPVHSLICANVGGELRNSLKGKPCQFYESNLRVRVGEKFAYVYPDGSVVCGPLKLDPLDPTETTVTNPTLVVEVTSPSTETYDRVQKFRLYSSIPSFKEYLLVSQQAPIVESYYRQEDGAWRITHAVGLDQELEIKSLSIRLSLAEVYRGVTFEELTNISPAQ